MTEAPWTHAAFPRLGCSHSLPCSAGEQWTREAPNCASLTAAVPGARTPRYAGVVTRRSSADRSSLSKSVTRMSESAFTSTVTRTVVSYWRSFAMSA